MSTLTLSKGNNLKTAPIGFSWTVLLFGGFVPLLRSDFLIAILMFIGCILTYGAAGIAFAFFYNKMYVRELIAQGYEIEENLTPNYISDEWLKKYLDVKSVPYATK